MSHSYSFDDKVADFEQAVREQILDAADHLLQQSPARNLAALRLLVGYFEPIAKYGDGYAQSGDSKRFFVKGCRDVIARNSGAQLRARQVTEKQLEGFYELARCGLAHGATLTFNVSLSVGTYAIAIASDGDKLSINPRRLLHVLRRDLDLYLRSLRDPAEMAVRGSFEARWDYEARL